MERAKPLVVQTLDVRQRSFYYGSRVAVPTLVRCCQDSAVWVVQTFCAPGPTYILKLGPPAIDSVPVQSGATV